MKIRLSDPYLVLPMWMRRVGYSPLIGIYTTHVNTIGVIGFMLVVGAMAVTGHSPVWSLVLGCGLLAISSVDAVLTTIRVRRRNR